jgi:hypothetical protein
VEELIKMLPAGGSAVAVIMVVMLFLRQQDRLNLMVETITKGFNEQINDSQKTFQEQILRLTTQQFDNQRLYQSQIQSLIDAHIKVSRETIMALKSLEASLKESERGQLQ